MKIFVLKYTGSEELKICFVLFLPRGQVRRLHYQISLDLCNHRDTAVLSQTWALGNGLICCFSLRASIGRSSELKVNISRETLGLLGNESNSILPLSCSLSLSAWMIFGAGQHAGWKEHEPESRQKIKKPNPLNPSQVLTAVWPRINCYTWLILLTTSSSKELGIEDLHKIVKSKDTA